MSDTILPRMNPEQVADEIGDFIIRTMEESNSTGCVIGLSGGVDSTVTAALIKRAFDEYNKSVTKTSAKYNKSTNVMGGRSNVINPKKLVLVGYILPSSTNNPADEEDGVKVAKRLGIRYEVQSIDKIVDAYTSTNPEAIDSMYNKGNLMSRIRANVLSTKAAVEKKAVAGTGNKDEDSGIGYFTLFGDGAVHMRPIANLPKRLVRQMAEYLGFEDIANRTPTAGLEPGQTDFKDLGYSYDVVELVLECERQNTNGFAGEYVTDEDLARHEDIKPLIEKELSQYEELFRMRKFSSPLEVVKDIQRRHLVAYRKEQIINPPVAQVTLDYTDGRTLIGGG